jgi:hypothetical protein
MRFHHRTSANHGYANGIVFEFLRLAWPVFVVLIFIGAIVGAVQGQVGSLILALAMGGGAWLGTRRGA